MSAPRPVVYLLDYDGTLAPFVDRPELSVPDEPLRQLLCGLAARAGTCVHIVSGRPRGSLEQLLGGLPIGLHAEHGFWSRLAAGEPWTSREVDLSWKEPVRQVMAQLAADTPGSFIEEKTAALAWHYRLAEAQQGAARAGALEERLASAGSAYRVLRGVLVVEAVAKGVNKGCVVPGILAAAAASAPPQVVAVGDDTSDEDLFAALPDDARSYRVGQPGRTPTRAKAWLADVEAVRALLAAQLEGGL